MDFSKSAWESLDGKKTLIGSFIAAVYLIGLQVGLWMPNEIVVLIIDFVFGVGVLHKVAKYVNKTS